MIRLFAILCLAGSTAACATKSGPKPAPSPVAITPTEQFTAKVDSGADEIMLAPHRQGLSINQAAALDNLVDRWRDAGGGEITIQSALSDNDIATVASEAVRSRLSLLGVEPEDIRFSHYAAGERRGDPIVVSYARLKVTTPKCGRDEKNFASSANNAVNGNFGCAITANMAAMVDSPTDLVTPRPMQPADAARREVVIGKYRQGAITSTAKDEQAGGSVSSAVSK